jgi:hypothetical protein
VAEYIERLLVDRVLYAQMAAAGRAKVVTVNDQ